MGSTLHHLHYHIIFSTYERQPSIQDCPRLFAYIGGIINEAGGKPHCVGGMADHVHIYCSLTPTMTLAKLVQTIKGRSSLWLNQKYPFKWQRGYAVFSVSASQSDHLRQYILKQEHHHAKQSFQDELRLVLDKHGVHYDENYLWD